MAAKQWPFDQHFGEEKNGQLCTYGRRVEDFRLFSQSLSILTGPVLFCFQAAACLPERSLVPALQEEVIPTRRSSMLRKGCAPPPPIFFIWTWKVSLVAFAFFVC